MSLKNVIALYIYAYSGNTNLSLPAAAIYTACAQRVFEFYFILFYLGTSTKLRALGLFK